MRDDGATSELAGPSAGWSIEGNRDLRVPLAPGFPMGVVA